MNNKDPDADGQSSIIYLTVARSVKGRLNADARFAGEKLDEYVLHLVVRGIEATRAPDHLQGEERKHWVRGELEKTAARRMSLKPGND